MSTDNYGYPEQHPELSIEVRVRVFEARLQLSTEKFHRKRGYLSVRDIAKRARVPDQFVRWCLQDSKCIQYEEKIYRREYVTLDPPVQKPPVEELKWPDGFEIEIGIDEVAAPEVVPELEPEQIDQALDDQ